MSETRHPQRWIAHVDLDAFFASVEQLENPDYRGRPVVVGARPGQRGVVAAASYEARRFGIRSAMPIAEASRRCPHAVFVRPDLARYRGYSRQVFAVLGTITPAIEAASIDEAYLDISGLEKLLGPPASIGAVIRERIHAQTGLTASVGIGPNRLIAKLGSEHRKPDGLTVVHPHEVLDFLAPMPVGNLRGLGRQTRKVFERLAIHSIAELRATPLSRLQQHLGEKAATSFSRQALGIASDRVHTGAGRKSISKETTFASDIREPARLRDTLRRLSAEVARTARREGLAGAVVTLKIRYAGFETHTRQQKRAVPTCDERDILKTAWQLFEHGRLPHKPVRLIGVGISGWADGEATQADLFDSPDQPTDSNPILATIDAVSDKFGQGLLQVGAPSRQDS